MVVPFEISASGLAQYPLQFPEGAATILTTATVPSYHDWSGDSLKKTGYCNCRCCVEVALVYVCALVVSVAPALFLPSIFGLILSAILPSGVLMGYCYCKYWRSLLKKQMAITFFEAIIWLIPFIGLFFVLSAVGYFGWCGCEEVCPSDAAANISSGAASEERSDCEKVCDQGLNCYAHDAFTAFILASLCEEILKFLCIRRITYASLVVDAQSLFVYGGCAALGFATVENVLYVMSGGVQVAATRALLSIPLHMSTGLLLGCALGYGRFLGKQVRFYHALFMPVLVHGLYDVFLFCGVRMGGSWPVAGFLLAIATSVFAWMSVRWLVIDLEVVPALDVRDLIKQGIVQRPTIVCCICCWEKPNAVPIQVGGERRLSSDGEAYTFHEFVEFFGREEAVQLWAQAEPAASQAAAPQLVGRPS